MFSKIKKNVYLIISIYLFAVALNTVIIPYNIIAGGLNGLGAIFEAVTPFSAAIFIFGGNLIILGLSYFFISPKYAISSILGANILYPLIIALVPINPLSNDVLLSSIFGGALTGIGLHFLSLSGSSIGGSAALGKIVHLQTGIAYSTSVSICDAFVVALGFFFFGLDNTLYAIIFITVCTLLANFLERGIQQAFVFHIITIDKSRLENAIIKEIGRGVTVVNAKGGFNAEDKNMLICVVKFSDVKKIKDLIGITDDKAFYYITSASSTYGGFLANISK